MSSLANCGKIGQNLLLAHPGSEIREHVTNGNARAPHAWFTEANFGIYDDSVLIIHPL